MRSLGPRVGMAFWDWLGGYNVFLVKQRISRDTQVNFQFANVAPRQEGLYLGPPFLLAILLTIREVRFKVYFSVTLSYCLIRSQCSVQKRQCQACILGDGYVLQFSLSFQLERGLLAGQWLPTLLKSFEKTSCIIT